MQYSTPQLMASSGKGKGSVKTLEWWKHLRKRKRAQNKRVREDGKKQANEIFEDEGFFMRNDIEHALDSFIRTALESVPVDEQSQVLWGMQAKLLWAAMNREANNESLHWETKESNE